MGELGAETFTKPVGEPEADDAPPAKKPAVAGGVLTGKVFKILLKLDDANDNTVLVAARTLVNSLKAGGSDLRTLANELEAEWEKQQKAKPAPLPPIDWPEVKAAITRYASDRPKVAYNKLLKALYAEVPALRGQSGREADGYIGAAYVTLGSPKAVRACHGSVNAATNPTRRAGRAPRRHRPPHR